MANVTEAQMEAYLRTFHEEYLSTVEQHLPAEVRGQLLRHALLPAPITGYVSTQLGAGYEYGRDDAEISIRRSSRRIEDLFVDGPAYSVFAIPAARYVLADSFSGYKTEHTSGDAFST